MVNSVTTGTSGSSADTTATKALNSANATVNLLLKSSDVSSALSSESSFYLPVSTTRVLSTLWSAFAGKNRNITQADVEKAVRTRGGGTPAADALWKQLNPTNKSSITAGDFASNTYMGNFLVNNLGTIQTTIRTAQAQEGRANVSNVLDAFV